MNKLQQIYCTHCTPDSSAYRLSTNGYAVRGGSLPGAELRRFYETIERFMGYHLPSDTPSELKTQLTATTAPRKMVFSPEVGELQMVCQVCYRQEDTVGRPGSYFAHALVSPNRSAQDTLTTRECLKLWGLPQWQIQDPLGDDLGTLESFESLDQWAVDQPVICDELLRQFLTVEDGVTITAGPEIVPDRLRGQPPAERQDLLRDCLLRYLEANGKKESLLLVAEPGLAALLFYGIARLLPPGPLSDRISFSTYEYDPTRLKTRLAATRYHEPERNDVPPEMYHPDRCRGAALNTWLPKRRTKTQHPADYAKRVIDLLVDGDWREVDEFHADLVHAGVDDSAGLDELARLDQQLATSFDPALDDQGRFPNAVRKRFCQRRVHRRLGDKTVLKRVVELNTREAFRVFRGLLYLLAVDPSLADDDPVLVRMLKTKVPEKEVGRFIDREEVPRQRRITVVEQFVTEHHKLPRGGAEYLPELIPLLSDETLEQFRDNLSDQDKPRFVLKLAEALLDSPERRGILPGMVESLSDSQLLDVLCDKRVGHLLRLLPKAPWPVLQSRLQDILEVLPDDPVRFSKRLRALDLAKKHLLPEALNTIVAWRKFEEIVGKLADTSDGVHDRPLLKAIDSAVPAQGGEFDPDHRVRQLVMITPLVEEQLESHPELDGIVAEFHLKMIIPIINEMTVPEFCEFAQDRQHQDVLNRLPAQEPVLSELLTGVLDGIHDYPCEFVERHQVLRFFKNRVAGAASRLEAWLTIGEQLRNIEIFKSRLATKELVSSDMTPYEKKACVDYGEKLGQALLEAMPRQFQPTADWGADQRDRVGAQIVETYLRTSSYDDSLIRFYVRRKLNDNQNPFVRAMLPLARTKPAAKPHRSIPPLATVSKPAGSRKKSAVSTSTILSVTAAVSVFAGIIMLLIYAGLLFPIDANPEQAIDPSGSDGILARSNAAEEGKAISGSQESKKSASGSPQLTGDEAKAPRSSPPPGESSTQKSTAEKPFKSPSGVVANKTPDKPKPPLDGKTGTPLPKTPPPPPAERKKKAEPEKAATPSPATVIAEVKLPGVNPKGNTRYQIKRRGANTDVPIVYDSINSIITCADQARTVLRISYEPAKDGLSKTVTFHHKNTNTKIATLSFRPSQMPKESCRLDITIHENDKTNKSRRPADNRKLLYYTPLRLKIDMAPDICLVLQPDEKYSRHLTNCPYRTKWEIRDDDRSLTNELTKSMVDHFKILGYERMEFTFDRLLDGEGKPLKSDPVPEGDERWRVPGVGRLSFVRGRSEPRLKFERQHQRPAKKVQGLLRQLRLKLIQKIDDRKKDLAVNGLITPVNGQKKTYKDLRDVCWEHRERILSAGESGGLPKGRITKARALELLKRELNAPRKGGLPDPAQEKEFYWAIERLVDSIPLYVKQLDAEPRAFSPPTKMFVRGAVNYIIPLGDGNRLKLPVIEYDKKSMGRG